MIDPYVVPCVLGWANEDTGPESLRLYALDAGPSPRWTQPHARCAETAIVEHDGGLREGDRYLVARVGDRFVTDETLDDLGELIRRFLAGEREEP
jgi:hypothetical protein